MERKSAKPTPKDLAGTNLDHANLARDDLHGANLHGATLKAAKLTGADLRGADLTDTNLTACDLREADLADADLAGSDLRGADLTGANPEAARSVADARFAGAAGIDVAQRTTLRGKQARVDEAIPDPGEPRDAPDAGRPVDPIARLPGRTLPGRRTGRSLNHDVAPAATDSARGRAPSSAPADRPADPSRFVPLVEVAMNALSSLDRRAFGPRAALSLVACVLLALLLTACGGKRSEDVAVDEVVNPDVTSSGDAVVPDGLETARLTVKDGRFGAEELVLQVDQPTILRMVNEDGTAYRFQIDGLVGATAVAPGGETTIDFTDPDAGTFEGRLLPQSGENALDTIRVVVQEPDGSA